MKRVAIIIVIFWSSSQLSALQTGAIHLHNTLNEPLTFRWKTNINAYDPIKGPQFTVNMFEDKGSIPAHETVKLRGPLVHGVEVWEDPVILFLQHKGNPQSDIFLLNGPVIGTHYIKQSPDGHFTITTDLEEQKKEGAEETFAIH